jgi:hypothetical protein
LDFNVLDYGVFSAFAGIVPFELCAGIVEMGLERLEVVVQVHNERVGVCGNEKAALSATLDQVTHAL